jgi:hypothetical protein
MRVVRTPVLGLGICDAAVKAEWVVVGIVRWGIVIQVAESSLTVVWRVGLAVEFIVEKSVHVLPIRGPDRRDPFPIVKRGRVAPVGVGTLITGDCFARYLVELVDHVVAVVVEIAGGLTRPRVLVAKDEAGHLFWDDALQVGADHTAIVTTVCED